MKKISLAAIAGIMAIGSFAAPNTDPKDCNAKLFIIVVRPLCKA